MSTPLDYGNITLAQKFDTILDQYQRQVAVISPEQQLTYQQLNEQATQVAEHLQQLEPKRQCRGQDNRQDHRQDSQLIGLHVELSIEAIIGLWGIIKAGGAFVPLDPAYPPDRLQHILDDTQLSVILTTQAGADMLPDHQAKLLLLDDLPLSGLSTTSPSVTGSSVAGSSVAGSSQPTEDIHAVHPQDLACCLYTSGSTGKPKGVMIEHQALVKQFDNLQHHYQLTTDDRVLQFALLTHIAGVEQVIMALLSGAALVIPGQKLWTASEFLPKVQQYGLTMVDLPASYYQALAQEWAANHVTIQDTPLRLLIVGGEVTSSEGVALWSQIAASHVRFLNVYGMTEVSKK
ncbi:MAG: AMP-binding protein [Chloroflexota bacterium]